MKTKLMAMLVMAGGALLAQGQYPAGDPNFQGYPQGAYPQNYPQGVYPDPQQGYPQGAPYMQDGYGAGVAVQPPMPGPGYIWIDGNPGYWALPPYVGAFWIGPRFVGGRWFPGYWGGPRGFVAGGFRGGVVVGGGYRGGFRGGFHEAPHAAFRGGVAPHGFAGRGAGRSFGGHGRR